MALKAPQLVGYLFFKLNAIHVDATEAVAQGHIARTRMLNKERCELVNNMRRVLKWKREAAKAVAQANSAVQQDSSSTTNKTSGAQEQKKKRVSILLDGSSVS